MKIRAEKLLVVAPYFSGLIAFVGYLLGEGRVKAHSLQALTFALAQWFLQELDKFLYDIVGTSLVFTEPVMGYNSPFLLIARIIYVVGIAIAVAAFFNKDILLCKEMKA